MVIGGGVGGATLLFGCNVSLWEASQSTPCELTVATMSSRGENTPRELMGAVS